MGVRLGGRSVLIALLLAGAAASATAGDWPRAANRYRKLFRAEFVRSGLHPDYREWIAGQIEQESTWREDAVSPAGARGLGQIMPGTERLLRKAYPEEFSKLAGDARSARFALRGTMTLMKEGVMRWRRAPERIVRYRWAADDYNGGPRWLRRERQLRDSWERDFETCRAAGRSVAACRENLEYADHALRRAQKYRGF